MSKMGEFREFQRSTKDGIVFLEVTRDSTKCTDGSLMVRGFVEIFEK